MAKIETPPLAYGTAGETATMAAAVPEGQAPVAEPADAQAAAAAQPAPASAPGESVGQAPLPAEGVRVQNPFMLLPPSVNFQAQQQKTPMQQRYDYGLLWQVLASNPQASELTRMIASGLTEGKA